jgi:hypothetical protein
MYTNFSKIPNIKFRENLSGGSLKSLHVDRTTGRWTDTDFTAKVSNTKFITI